MNIAYSFQFERKSSLPAGIIYGKENGRWYVQAYCNEPHYGQQCACQNHGESLNEVQAVLLARKLSRKYNIPIERMKGS